MSLREVDIPNLEPIQRVQLARHEKRPYALDFIERIFTDFRELHGDRKYMDDGAIIAGMAKFNSRSVVVVAHQKGRNVKERQERNFGMPKPDGYRKALRIMKLAEKFNRPIFTFIDTSGAYPGIDAEERGQAEAIALNLREMAKLKVPVIVTITGEGGSGGALAVGIGDKVNILENAVYSVITPEGCAAILWKDAAQAGRAAAAMKMTAPNLLDVGIVDEIIPEPVAGAHTDWDTAAKLLSESLRKSLAEVESLGDLERNTRRYQKFRRIGQFVEA
jgi:acetyl-CoA carboxylase carboxyl transferase subunit alpha